MTVAIPKWRRLKFLKFEMHAAIEIYSPSLRSLSDSSLRCGRVVQSIIQTGHCLTVVSIELLDTQSNSFRPLFNTNLNNFVITELVSTI